MSGAFQRSGFQNNAFQVDAAPKRGPADDRGRDEELRRRLRLEDDAAALLLLTP